MQPLDNLCTIDWALSTSLEMENLTEKQLLGLKMMNGFFGEDLFNELREASVSLLSTPSGNHR